MKNSSFVVEFVLAVITFLCSIVVIFTLIFRPFEFKQDYTSQFNSNLPIVCKNKEVLASLDTINFGSQFINIEYYFADSDLLQDLAIHDKNVELTFLQNGYRIKDCSLYTIKSDVTKFPEVANVSQISQYVFDILNINKNTLLVTGEKNEFILYPLDSKTLEENQIQSIKIVEKE
jgi:hypothetical protein